MKTVFPQAVRACLWSYKIDSIDLYLPDHRARIIHNVLDRGTNEAILWLRQTFSEKEITAVIAQSNISAWSKKSLALWSLIFNTRPTKEGRFA
jgi:hypothetical protein